MSINIPILLVIVVISYLIYDYIYKNYKYKSLKGPNPKSIIGNLLHINGDTHLIFQNDSKIYNDGKFVRYWFCDLMTIALFDVDLIREIYIKNADAVNTRTKTPVINLVGDRFRGIVTADENYWQFHREILMKSFTGRKIKTLTSSIEKETTDLITYMKFISKSEQPFSTRSNFMNFNSNIVFDYVFSRHIDNIYDGANQEQLKVLNAIRDLFEVFAKFQLPNFLNITQPFFYLSKKIFGHESDPLKEILRKYYKEHCDTIDLDNPRDVLDSIIVEYRKVGGKEEQCSVIPISNELILAGVETNSTTMEWFTLTLCNRPEFQEKLYNELSSVVGSDKLLSLIHRPKTPLFNATLKEILRLYPPVPFGVSRETLEPITIDNGKYTIPKGTQIIQSIYSIQRDEKVWSSPNEFLPERFLNTDATTDAAYSSHYFPYGIGVRNCMGMGFSQDELYILLANLVLNFKIQPTNANTKVNDTPIFGFSFRPNEFKVNLKSR